MRILVVCDGNSCRSQMAEAFLKEFEPSVEVYSAGIKPEAGIFNYTEVVMKESFIDIAGCKPKSIESFLYMNIDYLITLSNSSKEKCGKLQGKIRNRIHIPIEDPAGIIGTEEEILDKYREIRNKIKYEMYDFYLTKISPGDNNAV